VTPNNLTRTLAAIKRDLQRGNTDSLVTALAKAGSPELLRGLQEQKILLRIPPGPARDVVTSLLGATARRVLDTGASTLYDNYIAFTALAIEISARLSAKVKEVLERFPPVSCAGLLLVVGEYQEALFAVQQTKLPPSPPDAPLRQTVAATERHFHEQNALANGVFFATLRAFNEASRRIGSDISDDDTRFVAAVEPFDQLVLLAAEWNSLEFIVDSVSFGDFAVREVRQSPSGSSVKLEFADPKLSLYRRLAIRRRLALSNLRVRAPRNLKDYLAPMIPALVPAVMAYYETLCGCPRMTADDERWCVDAASRLLEPLELEDDLLFEIHSLEVSAHYIAALALVLCAQVVQLMSIRLPEKFASRLAAVKIPFHLITGMTGKQSDQEAIRKALGNLCTPIPTARYFNLVRMPFVTLGGECAWPLGKRYAVYWNTVVREVLIDGGSLGRSLGAIWEAFLAEKLRQGGWSVVARNVRLKDRGCVATDIDIGLLRGDLLLLTQVKAVTGSASNTYDHWKNRNIIEKGCRQARIAADLLRSEPQRLMSLTSRKVADSIRYIEPVVFTNCLELDRWEFEGVPVLGPAGIAALVQGAVIAYVENETGRVLEKSHVTPEGEPSTESILWILRNSLEPLVCLEDGHVDQETLDLEGVRWQIPTFGARN
jgi:hypothetical protein